MDKPLDDGSTKEELTQDHALGFRFLSVYSLPFFTNKRVYGLDAGDGHGIKQSWRPQFHRSQR